eukprot:1545146-Prorocentrum_lima.AAC.1
MELASSACGYAGSPRVVDGWDLAGCRTLGWMLQIRLLSSPKMQLDGRAWRGPHNRRGGGCKPDPRLGPTGVPWARRWRIAGAPQVPQGVD